MYHLQEEVMSIGTGDTLTMIKRGSTVQIKDPGPWYDAVCIIEYILDGIAYAFSPAHQADGLFKITIYNACNIVEYKYEEIY